jgi:N-acetylglucosaminyl-diphospho-decaprenol L-rhamnosyltransferase
MITTRRDGSLELGPLRASGSEFSWEDAMAVSDASLWKQPRVYSELSIVIVTYNSAAVLPGLLDSLPAGLSGIARFETIVVDNDSRDNSVDIALTHPTRPRIIRMGRNAGYAAAINAGAATVGPDADLLILNPDIRLHPGAARLLVDRLTDTSVGVAVPRLLEADGRISWSIRREPSVVTGWTDAILGGKRAGRIGTGEVVLDPAVYDREGPIDWATGAMLAVSARVRRIVGDWDESFFLYMEEVDYMRRVRECGFSVVYVPQAQAMHIGGEYSVNPRLSALLSANRIRYHRRHHGPISTAAFRLSVILGEGIRALYGPSGHRAAVIAALRPWKLLAQCQPLQSVRPDSLAPRTLAKSVQSASATRIKRS